MNYTEYLLSENWRKKRDLVFLERWKKCERCFSEKRLHVHHWSYEFLWDEPLDHLFLLCNKCHNAFHKKFWKSIDLLKQTISYIKKEEKTYSKTCWYRWLNEYLSYKAKEEKKKKKYVKKIQIYVVEKPKFKLVRKSNAL